jgi:hypothetical protein
MATAAHKGIAMRNLVLSVGLLLFGWIGPANAVAIEVTTFYFYGQCEAGDCSGTAEAILKLAGDYNLGDAISSSNFESFTYEGTNLTPGYTVTYNEISSVSGAIDGPLPAAETFTLIPNNGDPAFHTLTSGFWCVGACADLGNSSFYSASPVPEPMTLTLVGGGLLGMRFFGRRKPRTSLSGQTA